MRRRNFIRVAGGGSIAAATFSTVGLTACSSAMPPEAIEAWQGPGAEIAADKDVRRWLISYAILAPSVHNLQPWIVDLDTPEEIILRCDLQRLLPQRDSFSNQTMLSHGTFLELLDLAARERGLRADIALFPQGVFDSDRPDMRPIARIRLKSDATVRKDPLFAQILRRHTSIEEYEPDHLISEQAWGALDDAVKPWPLRFGRVGSQLGQPLEAHRRIALEAWRIELSTARTSLESFRSFRVGAAEIKANRDGFYSLDSMVVLLTRLGVFDRSKAPPDDYVVESQVEDFRRCLNSSTGFLWLISDGNDRVTQINAGRAYVRAQLAATAQGLSMQPLSQALGAYSEQAKLRSELYSLTGAARAGQTVQMWARVGYAAPVGPAPRRRLKDFIQA